MIIKRHHFAALITLLSLSLSACASAPAQSWAGAAVSTEKNIVYIANGTHLYAYNTADGALIWQAPPKDTRNFFESLLSGGSSNTLNLGTIFSNPALAGDTVIVTSFNKSVYALKVGDGTLKWTYPKSTAAQGSIFPGPVDPTVPADRLIAPASVLGDRIYVPSADNSLYVLDLDGQFQWRFETQGALWGAVLPTEDVIYVPSMDHHLYAVNATSHDQKWAAPLTGAVAGTPALSADGQTVFVGTLSNTLYALNTQDGSEKWKVAAAGWVWSVPLVTEETVYFADLGGNVYSINALNGAQNWKWQVKHGESIRGALALAGDTLLIAADKGAATESRVYAIKAADGTDKWSDGIVIDDRNADRLLTDPIIVGDTVVISPLNADQLVYALSLDKGEVRWKVKP